MTMSTESVAQLRGAEVIDASGDKVGTVEEIYLDQESGQPEWALVKTGLFGSKSTFVPLSGAQPEDDTLRVRYEKAQIKDAPKIDADQQLSQSEERELYQHYGLGYSGSGQDVDATSQRDPVGEDVSGPETDNAMTRSEEELRVDKTPRERGRVRLKKYVVTDEEHEVTLHEEVPVADKVAVPKERVRLDKETVTDEETVTGEVRQERIDVDDQSGTSR